jgi:hypothetical protein
MTVVKIPKHIRYYYRESDGVLTCWAWTCEKFGNPGHRWQFDTNQTFIFRDEADAILFALRWAE